MKAFLMLTATALFFGCSKDGFKPCIRGNNNISTETRTLADFDAVDYMMEGDIEIRKASRQEIVIEGNSNQLEDLKTKVSNGKLKIYSDRCFKNTDFKFIVYTRDLNDVKLSGSGVMLVNDDFIAQEMTFEVSGSGKISAFTESAIKVKAKISGSGELDLEGICDSFNAQISGSGKIRAYTLISNTANASISGSGNMELFVTNVLNAAISGSGNIRYKGTATINSNISGSGRVEKVQ